LAEVAAVGSSGSVIARTGIGLRQTEAETGAESGTGKGTGTGGETVIGTESASSSRIDTGTGGKVGIETGSASSSRIDTGTEEATWAGMTGATTGMTGTERASCTTVEGIDRTGQGTGVGADTQSNSRIVGAITHGSGSSSSITAVAEVAVVHSSSGEGRSRRANPSGESQVGAEGLLAAGLLALVC
jgi:hypothetical protein